MSSARIMVTCEIELDPSYWPQSDLDDMDDVALLECWREDCLEDLLRTARIRVRRGDQEGYEYVLDGAGYDRVVRVEYSHPREAGSMAL